MESTRPRQLCARGVRNAIILFQGFRTNYPHAWYSGTFTLGEPHVAAECRKLVSRNKSIFVLDISLIDSARKPRESSGKVFARKTRLQLTRIINLCLCGEMHKTVRAHTNDPFFSRVSPGLFVHGMHAKNPFKWTTTVGYWK